ncbi:hypothetical protein Syn7502_00632 [Synechococcus sp. PCC 7502]|uniref:hypothetical protein n=1 Tax=Synechococcus sp. PCC 7502 TaxID=1173263 RepID=UPI00029F819D|nr:hypothetical protein [Synechococcus sp. PCC 7502]AFY72781.1 hypothetical protein Syn7502_00632 [Synechococcus sp. PCC 7502]
MIVKLSDTNNIEISVLGQKMQAISYLGKAFLPTNLAGEVQKLVPACRRDLDMGLISMVVEEPNTHRLWTSVPKEMQI